MSTSFQNSDAATTPDPESGLGGRVRTPDPMVPSHVLYQAELHPDKQTYPLAGGVGCGAGCWLYIVIPLGSMIIPEGVGFVNLGSHEITSK